MEGLAAYFINEINQTDEEAQEELLNESEELQKLRADLAAELSREMKLEESNEIV